MTEKNSTAFSRREFFTALPGATMVMMMLVQKHQRKEKESNHLV